MSVSSHEIFRLSESELSCMFSENQIKIKEFSESSGYGIRAVKDRKVGFSYCTDEKDIGKTIKSAALLSRFSPTSDFSFAPNGRYKKLSCFDSELAEFSELDMKDAVSAIVDPIKKSKANPRVYFSTGATNVSLENTEGFEGSYRKTGLSIYAEATIGEGYGFSYLSSITMPKDFAFIGEQAVEMAKNMQNPIKPKDGAYTVVFSPEAFHSLLEVFLPSFSGDWKRRKITALVSSLGKNIFDEKLSIYDDPGLNAAGIQPFDDEGVPAKRKAIVEKGILKTFLYDREISALDGGTQSGFCTRSGFESSPSISVSNLEIKGGNYKHFEEELNDFILVKSLHGTHTSNMTTGDFGVEVNVAFHIKNKKSTPMRGFIISENIFNLFTRIEAIEKKQYNYDNLICPRMAFSSVKVVS